MLRRRDLRFAALSGTLLRRSYIERMEGELRNRARLRRVPPRAIGERCANDAEADAKRARASPAGACPIWEFPLSSS
jgi:hypothetical protein